MSGDGAAGGGGRGREERRAGIARTAVAVVVAVVALAACAPRGPDRDTEVAVRSDAVTVASFNFSESVIVAEIYAEAIRRAGIPAVHEPEVGPREIMQPALEQGLVDVVPEYLGSALAYHQSGVAVATADAAGAREQLLQILQGRGLTALAAAPAENQNGVVVTPQTAQRYGLREVSDLAPIAGELAFGGPPECPVRPFCLVGLQQTYDLAFRSFTPLDSGGRQTRDALTGGAIDVGLLFTTDGYLAAGDFVLLADDRNLQPPENVVPVVRTEVVDRYGERLVNPLDQVSAALTTADLADLNRQVSVDGADPVMVALGWIDRQGFEGG